MTPSRSSGRWMGTLVALVLATTAACAGGTLQASTQSTNSATTATTTVTPSATTTSPVPVTPSETPLVTGIVKGADGWSTYTNAELGFTLRFPTRTYAYNGARCAKVQEGNDWSYRPADGVVPATVIQDGSSFWVVQKVSWQLGDEVRKDGVSTFKSCTKMTTTAAMLRAYDTGHSDYSLNPLPITVTTAATRADVRDRLTAFFSGCPTLTMTGTQPSSAGPWREVLYSCSGDPTFPGGMVDIRWYRAQGLFVVFEFGQAYHIYTAKQHPVDQRIAASFTLLGS